MNWATSKKCLVIAHRGDTKGALENTLPAIESALKLGVDGIEVDLRITPDEEIILSHDPLRNEQTTSGLTTLEELLDRVGDRALLNLEIKTPSLFESKLEKKLVATLKRFRLNDSILLSSFSPLALARLKKLGPHLARGYLFKNMLPLHQPLLRRIDPFSVHPPIQHLSRSLRERVREDGRRLFVWTVNREEEMRRCLELQVDGIITDELQLLKSVIQHQVVFLQGGGDFNHRQF